MGLWSSHKANLESLSKGSLVIQSFYGSFDQQRPSPRYTERKYDILSHTETQGKTKISNIDPVFL